MFRHFLQKAIANCEFTESLFHGLFIVAAMLSGLLFLYSLHDSTQTDFMVPAIWLVLFFLALAKLAKGEDQLMFLFIAVPLGLLNVSYSKSFDAALPMSATLLALTIFSMLLSPGIQLKFPSPIVSAAAFAIQLVLLGYAFELFSPTVLIASLLTVPPLFFIVHLVIDDWNLPQILPVQFFRQHPSVTAVAISFIAALSFVTWCLVVATRYEDSFTLDILYLAIVLGTTALLSLVVLVLHCLRRIGLFQPRLELFHLWETYGGWLGTAAYLPFADDLWKEDYQEAFHVSVCSWLVFNWGTWFVLAYAVTQSDLPHA